MILKVRNLTKKFGGVKALDKVSFDVKKGEVIGLIGPNGSGKSTLFNALTSIFTKDGGKVEFKDIDITDKSTYEIAKLGIARTFQDAKPLPQITVRENIDLGFHYAVDISLANALLKKRKLGEIEKSNLKQIHEMLEEVGIDSKEFELASELSYGQGKLLEILKIMAFDGELVMLDEPFSGLFPEMIKLIKKLIKRLSESGKTIILVEHNMNLIQEICDRVIVLDAGKVIAEGMYEKVTKDPIVIESYLGE